MRSLCDEQWRRRRRQDALYGRPAIATEIERYGIRYPMFGCKPWLGGFTWTQLARALRGEEVVFRATARADAIFRVEIAPWCPEIF
jgi:hypothetical protein